ncbi:penicillin acylase family protein [Lysobacter capsici]|uniref:penicillin acylase family protein n=1 Tax=Lysobacter capsici TaxID=435897 RepID=UPI00287B7E1B|nr:penicillin acylase family protein [Lysobacter capsici]WND82354.1 penicillin acylase family protein [Lysobacter capsici]WND87550.1 penicillin acylase family protein [Lysobacter capsici]
MAKWIKRGVLALLCLFAIAAVGAWWLLRGSLPQLQGELALPGLSAPVTIQRDALGVVTVDAANQTDAMRALGYVHGQERYFEMDLLRRTAAGELSALFGERALDYDRRHRVHRLRSRVQRELAAFANDKTALLQAYSDGVNAGLRGLSRKPWPYLLLQAQPEAWTVTDSALVGYAMYFDLQDGANAREFGDWQLGHSLPAPLYRLLSHAGTSWDAPLFGAPIGDAVLPGADQVDLRKLPTPAPGGLLQLPFPDEIGSNNFAVAGSLTADRRAIVADDMHLGLRAPNLWFRARLRYADARVPGGRIDANGFTLPGLPALVVGSNGQVAWAFTNSYGDWADWSLEPGCASTAKPGGCAGLIEHEELIAVKGGAARKFLVRETAWGPLMHDNADGSALALRWSAHLPGALNMGLSELTRAQSVDDAMSIAREVALPVQNLVVGDRNGKIGWRLLGPIPEREGDCATTLAVENADPRGQALTPPTCPPWTIQTQDAPHLIAPPSGRLWTANTRTLDGLELERIGDGNYVLGARAGQIRDGLFAKQRFNERDLLAIQLDDRALFLQRWWKLLQDQAARTGKNGDGTALGALATAAKQWEGRAEPGSVSYRLVRNWRRAVHTRIANGLTAPAQVALGKQFEMPEFKQLEGVVWPLLEQRPANLLPRNEASWDDLLEHAARDVLDDFGIAPGANAAAALAKHTWGEHNTARICHPLASALPGFAKRALCMPFEQLPGDAAMPRVQRPDFGASERMVVSPGHEVDGIIHMPGGQSGHPLSPFWGAGHDDWVHGRPTPFLPGQSRYTLTLKP